jgi:hypothetical protein
MYQGATKQEEFHIMKFAWNQIMGRFYCLTFKERDVSVSYKDLARYHAVNTFHFGYKNQSVYDV